MNGEEEIRGNEDEGKCKRWKENRYIKEGHRKTGRESVRKN